MRKRTIALALYASVLTVGTARAEAAPAEVEGAGEKLADGPANVTAKAHSFQRAIPQGPPA